MIASSRSQTRADEQLPLFLGVDGGGSKTLAVVVDARGGERGRGHAGGSNFRAVGLEAALAQLRAAIAAAVAGHPLPLAAAWFGLAGLHSPEDADLLAPHLRPFARELRLTNDAELVLGSLEAGIGVALIAGTGAIALGRGDADRQVRVGGWGHLLGDEGSGYDIGRRGLQAVMRAVDGRGPQTMLLELVLRHWVLATPSEILAHIYQNQEKVRIAGLAPVVLRAASAGDLVARRILRHAVAELAHAALTAIDALELSAQPVPLALSGGLLAHERDLRAAVLARLRRRQAIGPVTVVAEPALSAARALASSAADVRRADVPPDTEEALREASADG